MRRIEILVVLSTIIFGANRGVADDANSLIRQVKRYAMPEAHQAVAVDNTSIYAIANHTIAAYDKRTGQKRAHWSAPADSPIKHLNSGFVHDGKIYCANSNWPKTPLKNSMEIFSAKTLTHLKRKTFAESEGAINWIVRHKNAWWIVFAFYNTDVHRTRLIRYDDTWKETGRWSFPEVVTKRFLPNSNSGGAFGLDGHLFVTGHDHAELYVLDVSDAVSELKYLKTIAAPIAGQGIAFDTTDMHRLFGIVRRTHEVVEMEITTRSESSR